MADLIEFHDVTFLYPSSGSSADSREAVLRRFNLSIREGECFCLLGPSGCGKTTALRLVAGFDDPVSGSVALEGQEIVGPGIDRGVVFQGEDSLFNWLNSIENISFGPKMRGVDKPERLEQARALMRLVGLRSQDEEKYPPELSGGMKQRIQIARVLANDPKILLLDEPFGALDAQTRSELQDEFVRIWGDTGKTALFITHDIAEAILLGDRIGVMSRGPNASIREILDVPLTRPRSRSCSEFGKLYEHVERLIKQEVREADVET